MVLDGQLNPLVHHLHRLLQTLPGERRAHHGGALYHAPPRPLERIDIHARSRERHHRVDDIQARHRRSEALSEHRALEGRDGIDILDRPHISYQPIERFLFQTGKGEVRRSVRADLWRAAALDEVTKQTQVLLDQTHDISRGQPIRTKHPTQVQPSALLAYAHVERVTGQ